MGRNLSDRVVLGRRAERLNTVPVRALITALILAVAPACTSEDRSSNTSGTTSVATTEQHSSSTTIANRTSTHDSSTSVDDDALAEPPVTTYPDGWFDIELVTEATAARPGDTVAVSIVCPSRGISFAASFEVVHADLTFAMEEVSATGPDVYSTSFVVPYWLEPGELELHGGCPRPPGPCIDTEDCQEYEIDLTPVVTLPLEPAGDRAWDSWRPVSAPFVDPTPEVGNTLPGGAVVTVAEPPWVAVQARIGDQLRVAAECPADAVTDGARFVVLPGTAIATTELGPQWGWSVEPDTEQPGRFVVSSETLLTAERILDEPLPWFVEVPATSTMQGESVVTIVGDIGFRAGLYRFDDADRIGLVITAVCEDVGMPFDPRSVDSRSMPFLVEVDLVP